MGHYFGTFQNRIENQQTGTEGILYMHFYLVIKFKGLN